MASLIQAMQPSASNNANIITRHRRKSHSPEVATLSKVSVQDYKVDPARTTETVDDAALSCTPPLHEYLHYLLEHMKWDSDATKSKLKQLMHYDGLERDSLHTTLAHCLNEIDRLHDVVLKKADHAVGDSNQAEESSDARPEDETNNEPEEEKKQFASSLLPPRGAKYHVPDAIDTKQPPANISPTFSPLPRPQAVVTPASSAFRRRSSLRRKSLTSCKSSPGKVSVSPGKHGMANQLVLVKAKKPKQNARTAPFSSITTAKNQRWAIKIARKFKPLNLSLFTFHPAAAAIPPPVLELGPQQNAMMLRQLRYVKGVMHELPWAKGRLRDMLSQYTQKELSKELLFPQLSHLSTQVQDELTSKSQAQKSLLETKSKLTVTLQLAKSVINDLHILKFGRRGKPHETKLFYDECHPSMLYWQSKQGERSNAFLPLHAVKAIHVGMETAVLKKAAKKTPILDPDCFLSLVTEERTLDLKLKNALQRDWLLKALREVVEYAVTYRANFAAKKTLNVTPRLRRM
ncbi:hypothetical protein H257_09239 [Aphanomyces astaci]|uniref:Uncharacterized protein n=1 Tax=Aphanomyces astaci TaxID=112090 RepID=W4GBW7_APHAT|nr:hypothetical protein H257_09239 [Aphanomyces astaci]ETV76786.1 hypothetical protein H257_09239 [Aphanomyces astaci]|eukprot:XP_009833698.1 hypothetical protein H257_09239 [Aphanomyces astaci]